MNLREQDRGYTKLSHGDTEDRVSVFVEAHEAIIVGDRNTTTTYTHATGCVFLSVINFVFRSICDKFSEVLLPLGFNSIKSPPKFISSWFKTPLSTQIA